MMHTQVTLAVYVSNDPDANAGAETAPETALPEEELAQ